MTEFNGFIRPGPVSFLLMSLKADWKIVDSKIINCEIHELKFKFLMPRIIDCQTGCGGWVV